MNKIAVVIPSFNSIRWLNKLIKQVLSKMPKANIIVVDDDSPDKTAESVQKKFGSISRVKLIVRRNKGGRGTAVLEGFRQALRDKKNQYFVEMDSDLAHDPKDIPKLVKQCQYTDVVIGSKYVKGSSIVGQEKRRQIFSQLANIFLKLILGIPINDYTNGFRCYTRNAIKKLLSHKMTSKGFIVLSEGAYFLHQQGFTFSEVPVTVTYFINKKSSFNLKEVTEALLTTIQLLLTTSSSGKGKIN